MIKRKLKKRGDERETEELREKLQNIDAPTTLGKSLLELSRKSLESGVTVLDAEEIMSELGRSRCK